MGKLYHFCVNKDESGLRVDSFLKEKDLSLSRSYIKKLILSGSIKVNKKKRKPHYILKEGDSIEVVIPPPKPLDIKGEDIPLNIVYEDKFLIIVNKSPGMVVHPAPSNYSGTLVNALMHYCKDLSGIGGIERPGILHRLDKDTSGLLLIAKDDLTHEALSQQLKKRTIKKAYLVLVKGAVKDNNGLVETFIGRDPAHRKKMAVLKDRGRIAISEYRVIERFIGFTLLEIMMKTGRTHQIRVHMAYIRHPVLGDSVYGRKLTISKDRSQFKMALSGLKRQALHAYKLGFTHPRKKKYMEFEIPLPEDIKRVVDVLRGEK